MKFSYYFIDIFFQVEIPSFYTYESLHMSSSYLRHNFPFEWFQSQSKYESKGQRFFIQPLLPHIHRFPVINIPLERGIYFIIDETTLTHQIQPKTIVYVWVHSWCCTVQGFGLMNDYMSDFPDGSDGEESACNSGDLGLITGWERSHGNRNGYTLFYILAWRIPQTEECGRLQAMGLQNWTRLSN